jgi:hypothetical protein
MYNMKNMKVLNREEICKRASDYIVWDGLGAMSGPELRWRRWRCRCCLWLLSVPNGTLSKPEVTVCKLARLTALSRSTRYSEYVVHRVRGKITTARIHFKIRMITHTKNAVTGRQRRDVRYLARRVVNQRFMMTLTSEHIR